LKEYVSVIPEHLVRRFISANQDAVVVSGRVPECASDISFPHGVMSSPLDHGVTGR